MAVIVASATTESVAANTKTADRVSGQYQHVGAGKLILMALPSATGMNVTLKVNGVTLVDDLPCPAFGATGGMDASAHVILAQNMRGGRVELFFRNTTAGALTVDYSLLYEP